MNAFSVVSESLLSKDESFVVLLGKGRYGPVKISKDEVFGC